MQIGLQVRPQQLVENEVRTSPFYNNISPIHFNIAICFIRGDSTIEPISSSTCNGKEENEMRHEIQL